MLVFYIFIFCISIVLVFLFSIHIHIGGGTFDVSIMQVYQNQIVALASEGDPHLGGADFDEILVVQ